MLALYNNHGSDIQHCKRSKKMPKEKSICHVEI